MYKSRDRRVSGRHDETCCRRAWAADAAEPLRENLPTRSEVGGKGENTACSEIAAAAAIAHGEQISVGGVGAPEAQERLQRERRIRWRRVAKLIFGIDTVTIGARADFTWAEGDPIALLDDAVVVIRSGELPGDGPVGGNDGRLRAVAHQFGATQWRVGPGAGVIKASGRVHWHGQDAATGLWTVRAVGVAP